MPVRYALVKKKLNVPLPIYLAGYSARTEYSHHIHDDLYVNTMYLTDDKKALAIVSCDLLGIYQGNYRIIVDKVKQTVAIPQLEVVISSVHSHSTPALRHGEYNENLDTLMDEVIAKISEGIQEADKKASTAPIGFAEMALEHVGANRRDSSVKANTILKLLRFDLPTEKAVAVNFNCHPTLLPPGNMEVSKDFQGFAMEKLITDGYTPMFLQGACGDISTRFTRKAQDFADAKRLGALLADAVKQLDEKVVYQEADSFSYQEHSITLPIKTFHDAAYYETEIKRYQAQLEEKRQTVTPAELRIYETALQGIEVEYRLSLLQDEIVPEVPVGVLHLGDIIVVFTPFELFSRLADYIYANSCYPHTMVVGYSYDVLGYLPDTDSYESGGYEVLSCHYAQGAGEHLAERITELINQL